MNKYKRILDLPKLLEQKSFFLLGPRATGKTFLINQQLSNQATIINLLKTDQYLRFSTEPHTLEDFVRTSTKNIIVIDEIQRIPQLLNEVHHLIESSNYHFLLTGSSARKLKAQDVNLLAGRAWEARLFPLTSHEIPEFNLQRYLHFGGLPDIYAHINPLEQLYAYTDTYLKEEIQAESLTRTIPAFTRFLQTAAITSGHILNYTNLSSDLGIPASTLREYYRILEDTLIGFTLPAWTKSVKRKPSSTGKFFLFDIGVRNILAGDESISDKSELFGNLFEHFIILETRAYLSYRRKRKPISFWRSKHGHEVDLLIGDDIAIEIKSANRITQKHAKGLKSLKEEGIFKRYLIVSQDTIPTKKEGIESMQWQTFLEDLWADKIV